MKSIIIEDSRLARKELLTLLKAHPQIEVLAEAANAEEGIRLIQEHRPELLFLDIQLPGKDGFGLLEALETVPKVIFTTAFDQYAIRSFEYNTLDYLLKPIKPERLAKALEKIDSAGPSPSLDWMTEENQVFVKEGDQCWIVKLAEIRLFQVEGNYTRIHFAQNRPLILKSLNYLESRLDPKVFFRANRKEMINLKWIERIEPWFSGNLKVFLRGGGTVEVSRRQAVKIRELLAF